MADVATSVLARLKNKAAKSGRSYQLCLIRSLTGYTQRIANPSEPVKDKRLRRACGILDSSSRACCAVVKSGLRRTNFIHAGVQLALAICESFNTTREALIQSARAVSERFFTRRRFQKRRNTVCISRFWNCTAGEKIRSQPQAINSEVP